MILERVYLILFGFLFLDAFYRTTMFPQTFVVNQWIPTLTLLALIFLKLLLYGREQPLQSILIGVLALSFLVIYKITRDINLPIMAYLVIGAYGVSFRKIISVYTAIGIPLLLFCIVSILPIFALFCLPIFFSFQPKQVELVEQCMRDWRI